MRITPSKKTKNILCVIPARGGSQGIVDKNLQVIGDYPLVEYSIIHAYQAGIHAKNIYVSSDSEKILDIARKKGDPLRPAVVASRRPDDISGSTSSTEETLLYVLGQAITAMHSNDCEHILLLQPTSPIRFKHMLSEFIDYYLDNDYDSVFTATKFDNFFWRFLDPFSDELTSGYDPLERSMRQGLEREGHSYFENGNAYLMKKEVLLNRKCRLGGESIGVFTVSELEGMQIDTPEELKLFRAIFSGEIAKKVGCCDI